MDTRTRYVLPPVVPEGSPASTDPGHSSAQPGCEWRPEGEFRDIRYEVSVGDAAGIAKITINRPEKRNAFRPQTLFELQDAFNRARDDDEVGVIILTGQGDWAFCSGGDQVIRGNDGYIGDDEVAQKGIGRLNVLDLQVQIRRTPKPVIAMVAGLRHRRWPRPARGLRPVDRRGQRPLPADGAEGRLVRRWLRIGPAGAHHRDEAIARDLVPVSAVRRRAGLRLGPGELRGAHRGPRDRDGRVGAGDARAVAAGPADAEGVAQRGRRRPGRHPAARGRRHAAVLHDRGGARRPRRLQGEARPDFRQFPKRP